jgi:hypothetical protein
VRPESRIEWLLWVGNRPPGGRLITVFLGNFRLIFLRKFILILTQRRNSPGTPPGALFPLVRFRPSTGSPLKWIASTLGPVPPESMSPVALQPHNYQRDNCKSITFDHNRGCPSYE